ncbi:STM3941 family protein [Streptomyces sp. NPDC001260]|uniref:STM3941 family protein n=1 Tax=Streptomyces sp. NPDC001260 TaxID=3364551 RepID=UPI003697FDB8
MITNGVPQPPTVYPLAKARVWAMLFGSLVFVALGIVFLVAHSTVKMTMAGAAAVPFFGLCAVLIILRLLRDRPELVVDDAGVEHVRLGRFGWDEIAAVRIREQQVRNAKQRFIELVLHDPDAYLTRAPRLVRSTASMNARLGIGPANMATNTLPVPPEEVVEAMRRHRPGLAVQY